MGEKYFTVSYDDGTEQDILVIALMEKYGIKGTFNLSSGIFGKKSYIRLIDGRGRSAAFKDGANPEGYIDHFILNKTDAKKLYSHPNVEVASHGSHHLVQTGLTPYEAFEEITLDVERLSELFGYRIVGHAFPKDTFNENVISALRNSGIRYARRVCHLQRPQGFEFDSSKFMVQPTCWQLDPFAEDLLKEFVKAPKGEKDAVFFMWGHSYELDYGTKLGCYEHLERLFDIVSKEKDVRFVTNRELFGIMQEKIL